SETITSFLVDEAVDSQFIHHLLIQRAGSEQFQDREDFPLARIGELYRLTRCRRWIEMDGFASESDVNPRFGLVSSRPHQGRGSDTGNEDQKNNQRPPPVRAQCSRQMRQKYEVTDRHFQCS